MLILRKFDMKILQICPPYLSDVATLPWEIQKSFQQYYSYILLRCLKRKQTVTHLPTPPENVTTLTCELQFFYLTEGLLRSFKRWGL